MKIEQLHLKAVGPFTDLTLDLRAGDKGLHLIFGPNEAGKSSALRAIHYLLFGFPTRLSDDFVHGYKHLRIGAQLKSDQGQQLHVVRRKANQGSLRDANDDQKVAEQTLQAFLGNADEDLFRNSFGIDHDRLVQGGNAIVRGEGDLGQMLFSGAGVSDLRQLETKLDDELNAMFSSSARASKPTINNQLRQLDACRERVRDLQLRPAQWQGHHDTLQEAIRQKSELERQRGERRTVRDRTERIRKALTKVPEYRECEDELRDLDDVVVLSPSFNQRRETVLPELKVVESRRRGLLGDIEKYERERDAIDVSTTLLDSGPRLDSLEKELHRYQDAQADRPTETVKLNGHEAEAHGVLRELGEGADLVQATSLLLPMAERIRIQQLIADHSVTAKSVADGAQTLIELKARQQECERQLEDVPRSADSKRLQHAVTDTLKLGEIDEALVDLARDLKRESKQAARKLAQLPGWSGDLEQLEGLDVPLQPTVDRYEETFQKAENRVETSNVLLQQTREEVERHQANLAELSAQRDVPTEDQLQTIRQQRDQAWQRVRSGDHGPDASVLETKEFLESIDVGSRNLEQAFEHLMTSADALSDRLRHEAERVARHSQLLAELRRMQERLERTVTQQSQHESKLEQLTNEWNSIWQTLGVAPLPPRDMRDWLREHRALLEQAVRVRELRDSHESTSMRVAKQRQSLAEELKAAGRVAESERRSLADLLRDAQETLEDLDGVARNRRDLDKELQRLRGERSKAERSKSLAEDRRRQWEQDWESAVANLPRASAEQPAAANQALELLNKLSLKLNDIQTQRQRLEEIDRFCERFELQVRELAGLTETDLPRDGAVEATATEILARYRAALEQDRTRKRLETELRKRRQAEEQAAVEVNELQSRRDQLCSEAGCDSPNDLREAWERSLKKEAVQQRAEHLRQELRELADGTALAEFLVEAGKRDRDELSVQVEQLNRELEELDRKLVDEVGQTMGREELALKQMDSSGAAAEQSEAARDVVAGIAELAEEYAILRLAHSALQRGIEHYRQQHQDPILEIAGRVFARLTCNAFQGLKDDLDQDGRPVLLGVRAGHAKTVGVSAMSDGTADQLYFALRYAWLTRYLESHESLPFIVDDILIRFDDERSRETLKLLAELSERTQVVFFTHHRHLVDLAEKQLPSDVLFVHDLART